MINGKKIKNISWNETYFGVSSFLNFVPNFKIDKKIGIMFKDSP